MNISELVEGQRKYFSTGKTLPIEERKKALLKLREGIVSREKEIFETLSADLGKCACEAYMTEIGMVLEEITFLVKNLKKFAAPHKVSRAFRNSPQNASLLPRPTAWR